MNALLVDPEMDYLCGLGRLRTFLVNTQHDLSRRRWIGRDVDPDTGYVRIAPNNYNAAMTELLLRCALTLDKRERDRAGRVGDALARGEIPDTERNRHMSAPQFELIGARDLVAIDLIWAQDSLQRPFQALRIWDEVHNHGLETDVPEVTYTERRPMPQPKWLHVGRYEEGYGFFDPIAEGLCESCSPEGVDPLMGEAFDVDIETAWFILDEERDRLLQHNVDPGYTPTGAFWYYVNLGVVQFRPGQDATLSRMLRRGEFWREHGLAGDIDVVSLPTISDAEYRALKTCSPDRAVAAGQVELPLHFPAVC